MRPLTGETTVQLLMALELPESISQDDRLASKASIVELRNILNSVASFAIVSINQQYWRVANSLMRIDYTLSGLILVSPYLQKSVPIISHGLIVQALCRSVFW